MIYVDVDSLKDILYHPNMVDFNYFHKVMAKDQEWGGKSCLDTDLFYPVDPKLVYYKNSSFEGLVH